MRSTFSGSVVLCLGLFTALPVYPSDVFDVVSVKPSVGTGPRQLRVGQHGSFDAADAPVDVLVEWAYGVKNFRVTGAPGWFWTDHFDVHARADTAESPTMEVLQARLQAMLADRFQLKSHWETKDRHVYLLVPSRRGAALPLTQPADCVAPDMTKPLPAPARGQLPPCGILRITRNSVEGFSISLQQLIPVLEDRVDMPVVDNTGRSERYNIHLSWSAADGSPVGGGSVDPAAPAFPADVTPALASALQEQLGLRFQPSSAPTRMLVIDRIERPSPN